MIEYKLGKPKKGMTDAEVINWRLEELFEGGKEYVISSLADIVYDSQKPYVPTLTKQDCIEAIDRTMHKTEFINTTATAINLDYLTEQGMLLGELQDKVYSDKGSFGVDETLINVAQIYGTIAISNAFALDKIKPGVIGEVDVLGKTTEYCTTFLDDIFCAVAGSAMGKIAHNNG